MPLKGKSKTARKRPAASDDGAKSEKAQGDGTKSPNSSVEVDSGTKMKQAARRLPRTTITNLAASQPVRRVRITDIAQLPHHILSWQRQIKNSLKDITEKNGILRGVKSLGEQVTQVGRDCDESRLTYMHLSRDNPFCNYLQDQTNITLNLHDEDVRCKELGDVIFYYLIRDEEPDEHVQNIIYSLLNGYSWEEVFWHVLCCHVLQEVKTFAQLYERLGNNLTAIQYLLYKQPMLLLNYQADWLMERLIDHLPYDKLHQIITDIRDRNGQTHMFYASFDQSQRLHAEGYLDQFTELYSQKFVDLYGLLSIRNIDGQTALHVNTRHITKLMADTYTLAQRSLFINLISITDNNNQTAVQVSNDDRLSSLIFQVENNEYMDI